MRIFFSSDLSIKKLSEIYNSSVTRDLQTSKIMFRRVLFCTKFNIGLRSPASDVRSCCTIIDSKIQKFTTGPEKQQLFVDKTAYKRRAKVFSELLRVTQDDEVTLCIDMQQIQNNKHFMQDSWDCIMCVLWMLRNKDLNFLFERKIRLHVVPQKWLLWF